MGLARINTPLKRILDEEGRRQSWLAERLTAALGRQVGRAEVNRWVHGLHDPEDATKDAIAEALGRTRKELFPSEPDREVA